jgi:phospholipase C
MQENRSLDHYFGTLSGVRGFDDPAALKLEPPVLPDTSGPPHSCPIHVNPSATPCPAR